MYQHGENTSSKNNFLHCTEVNFRLWSFNNLPCIVEVGTVVWTTQNKKYCCTNQNLQTTNILHNHWSMSFFFSPEIILHSITIPRLGFSKQHPICATKVPSHIFSGLSKTMYPDLKQHWHKLVGTKQKMCFFF